MKENMTSVIWERKCEKVKKKEANLIEEEARRKIKETYKSKGKDKINAKKIKMWHKWCVGVLGKMSAYRVKGVRVYGFRTNLRVQ